MGDTRDMKATQEAMKEAKMDLAYRDLNSNYNNGDIVKEGWLWKKHQKAQLWSGWHRRYFILRKTDSTLLYYRNQNTSKFRGKIELGTNSDVNFRGRKDATAHRRELYQFMVQGPASTGSNMFLLGSPTEEEANSWLKALKKCRGKQ